ncbi:deoxyhypusine synthase [Candidatus Woesearchaeota archaeon]|nr:MAG: deoxyhypusine synthase [Candidatus Woesearchaeota archaeon]
MKTIDINQHHSYQVKNTETLDGYPEIKGYDFEKPFDFKKFLQSFSTTGFQATNLASAIEIAKSMKREKATIFLSYTSNMISSGVRDVIKFLVKHKQVHCLVTSAGGIEEDVIKSLKPFVIGDFNAKGSILFEKGVNRTGNIFVPNDRFAYFEKFITPMLENIYQKQKTISAKQLIQELGKAINSDDSVLHWAYKNDIPVFCPGLMDGSFGDLIVFFKHKHPDFAIDITQDVYDMSRLTLNAEKTGVIILGGGIAKHFLLNANIFREGANFAIYINTADEFDGSDSGAKPDEAVSWGKINVNAPSVKVHCDATIAFPLLVAGVWT